MGALSPLRLIPILVHLLQAHVLQLAALLAGMAFNFTEAVEEFLVGAA